MSRSLGRRDFLRGRFANRPSEPRVVRPPFAIAEAAFARACDSCLKCVPACDAGIIRVDPARQPVLQFTHGECSFCLACVDACPTGALDRELGECFVARAEIATGCLEARGVYCRSCADACPASAIRFSPHSAAGAPPVIDSDRCNGCGACVAPCPVGAVDIRNPLTLGEAA
ncbi:MAG: ferredoxin-type protein NapF [Hyphomicrobiaceae bacterium]|nr:ferredoxin-type protein NapF [Hyphomicrobiaceae bacterium]